MAGIIRLDDLRPALMAPELGGLVIARDVAVQHPEYLYPSDTLNQALGKMAEVHTAELPVVARPGSGVVLGLVSRHELLQAYSANMESLMGKRDES